MEFTSDSFPILVGISGKRSFTSDQATNSQIRDDVSTRLARMFRHLSKEFPYVPKILLTGGACGTDLLAARAALSAGPDWSVALVLPYAAALFEKDFAPAPNHHDMAPDFQADLDTFKELLASALGGGARRVIAKVLPALDTACGTPTTREQLDKDMPQHEEVLRREHYEQVGQFIAETAMLMITVMDPAATPDRHQANGGTARIAAVRRSGQPDGPGTGVACRSGILRHEWDTLLAPSGGYLWLVDPIHAARPGWYPTAVLPPLMDRAVDDVYLGQPGSDMPHGDEYRPRTGGPLARLRDRLATRLAVKESLHQLTAFHDFERLRRKGAALSRTPLPPAEHLLEEIADPLSCLVRLRDMIRWPQAHAKNVSRVAFYAVATLFVLAIMALEVWAKFMQLNFFPLLAYVALVVCIVGIVFWARRSLWQPRSEDYRAVSEMLRLQRAWWAAGLRERVDRVHLQGADPQLARSRDAMRFILGWVWLRSPWPTASPPAARWDLVHAPSRSRGLVKPRATKCLVALPGERAPKDWIGDQIRYYGRHYEDREDWASLWNTLTWLLFTASGGLALMVVGCVAKSVDGIEVEPSACFTEITLLAPGLLPGTWRQAIIVLLCLVLTILTGWYRLRLHKVDGNGLAILLNLVAGAVCAFFLGLTLQGVGGSLNTMGVSINDPADMAEHLTVVIFVSMTAAAGAVHFLSEKLGFEAEAFAYRDALDKFERAERALAANADPVSGKPRNHSTACTIVRQLGVLALRENESWLKAHRERPLSPVVG